MKKNIKAFISFYMNFDYLIINSNILKNFILIYIKKKKKTFPYSKIIYKYKLNEINL